MAVIARVGPADSSDDLIIWGCLTDLDAEQIRLKVYEGPGFDVTIDLREIEEVTEDGCFVLKSLGHYLQSHGRRLILLYRPTLATRSFETTGLLEDPEITFAESTSAEARRFGQVYRPVSDLAEHRIARQR